MSLLTLALSVGIVLGPVMGGVLSERTIEPWFDFATPLWTAAALAAISFVWILFGFCDTAPPSGQALDWQRPDKLRVITPGDGPRTEFYYDGKTAQAYEPAVNLVAVAEAPDTIDAMLRAAFEKAAIYFPFTDVIVSDPLKMITENLRIAFVVGKSIVVGDVPTDIVVLVGPFVHVQLWIGSDDKLPRLARAIFIGDPSHYRHTVALSDWKLDEPIAADAFTSAALAGARKVEFVPPAVPITGAAPKK
jgi:hypothetical protein